jgi:hypothetical protein
MRAKFIGDPNNNGEGPKVTTTLGKTFRRDAWTAIEDEKVFLKLEGNSHFLTERAANDDASEAEAPELETEADLEREIAGEDAERPAILAELETLGADKPHHKTGLPRLRELLTGARAKAEEEAFFNGED